MNGNSSICEIDGLKDPAAIAKMFKNKFSSVSGVESRVGLNVQKYVRASGRDNFNLFSGKDKFISVKNLIKGVGYDGIHNNHLSSSALEFVGRLFNSCLIHSYFPDSLIAGIKVFLVLRVPMVMLIIVPTNYREVMISSNIFKLFEYSLLPSLKYFTSLSSLQFGYRPNTSTMLATAVVKEILTKFTSDGSSVYCCFLDLCKAFERVSHARLY